MNIRFKQSVMILAIMIFGLSCGKDPETQQESALSTSVPTLTFEHTGGVQQLAVSSNTDWTVDKSGCVWVTPSVLAGSGDQTVSITAQANTGAHRSGKIRILAGDKTAEVTVTQYSAVLSFGEASVSGILKSNLPIGSGVVLIIPYSGGVGNESFTVSFTASDAGISPVTGHQVTLTEKAGEIAIPLTGTPVAAGEVTFTFTTTCTNPTTGAVLAIAPLVTVIEQGATLALGDLSLTGNLLRTKTVKNMQLSLPYTDALGIESFNLSVAISGTGAPGIIADALVQVNIDEPGAGVITIPLSGIPTVEGQVSFTVTGDAASATFTLNAAVIEKTVTKTVTDDGNLYYNGAFVISGVMPDPRGSDALASGTGSTFFNPHRNNLKEHDGPYEYMQFLALEDINFAATPYSVIVCRVNKGASTPGPTDKGWLAGGAGTTGVTAATRTYKFNLTVGTVVKGEFFYVGGTSKALTGYRDDAASNVSWPHVSVGLISMQNSKWIRTIPYNDADVTGDDGIGGTISGLFQNISGTTPLGFDGIAVFEGTTVEKNTVPMDAVFFGQNNDHAYNEASPDKYFTVPLNDWYDPTKGYYGQGDNTKLLDAYASGAADRSEFHKFGGELGIDNANTKVWITKRETTCLVLADPGLFIGAPSPAFGEGDKWDPAKESDPNPYLTGYTKRLATLADIEAGADVTKITDQ
ncbi:MAG: BACON domain-containing protein [Bacteroidales bacterium]|jgi:hypothetical protein|nr:BACON domain-containing protein [Bacteroidales bacterium]